MATRSERRYGSKADDKTPNFGESKDAPKGQSAPPKGPEGKKWTPKKDLKKGTNK